VNYSLQDLGPMLIDASEYLLHFGGKSFQGVSKNICRNWINEPVAGGERPIQTFSGLSPILGDFILNFHILTWRISPSPQVVAHQCKLDPISSISFHC
jgi:hypothetical protein